MSTADALRGLRTRRAQAGFSILEALIVTFIVATITLVIERTVSSLTDTERLMRAIRNTADRGQQASYRLRDVVSSSRKIFGNDTVGNAYLGKIGFGALPLLAGSRLPKIDELNPLGPDTAGDPRTGNVLLFVRQADPVPAKAVAASKKMRLIDTYRIVCVYLSQSTKTVVAGGPPALDLVEWRSDAFPSYAQIQAMTVSAEKKSAVADLYNRFGFDYLWDFTQPVASAFYAIDGIGNIASTPTAVTSIPEDLNVSKRGRFVAGNMAVARTDATSFPRASVFTVDAPATWSPHGFECKICGTSGSRKVWMRLTVEQQASKGRVPAQQTTVVATARDV